MTLVRTFATPSRALLDPSICSVDPPAGGDAGGGAAPPAGGAPAGNAAPVDWKARADALEAQNKTLGAEVVKLRAEQEPLAAFKTAMQKALGGEAAAEVDPAEALAKERASRAKLETSLRNKVLEDTLRTVGKATLREDVDAADVLRLMDAPAGLEVDLEAGKVRNPTVLEAALGTFLQARPWMARQPNAAPAARAVPPPVGGAPPPPAGGTPPPQPRPRDNGPALFGDRKRT